MGRTRMLGNCRNCGEQTLFGLAEMIHQLQQRGMLRREKEPPLDLVLELFQAQGAQVPCPHCQACGLLWKEVEDLDEWDEWAEERFCDRCKRPIAPERLELFPNATRCAACQAAEDQDPGGQRVFCPHCGDAMISRTSQRSGVTRYILRCPACGLTQE